jgi:5,10-methylenetetrahydromethanopterin reductase
VVVTWITPRMIAETITPHTAPGARVVAQLITLLSPDPDRARTELAGRLTAVGKKT